MSIPGVLYACHFYIRHFTEGIPQHHCRIQNQTSAESLFSRDGRHGDLLRVSIPMDKAGKPEMCLRFTEPQWQLLNANVTEEARLATEDCLDGWVYDKSVFLSTIVTEWDLVCGQKLLKSTALIMLSAGQLAGSLVFGILSDRFGRRTILMCTTLMVTITGTCAAFVPTFAAYAILRFLTAAALIGANITKNCLTLEWTPIERRVLVNASNVYAYSLGQILLAAWAYLVRDWRWLQFSTSVSYGIIFLFSMALPESARWLISHNKLHMAVKTLQKVAWINGQKEEGRKLTPDGIMSHIQEDLETVKSTSHFRDLFQTPGICKISLCIVSLWFTTGFSVYGILLDFQKFGITIYLVQVLFAIIDLPVKLLVSISMSYLGRRFTLIFLEIFSGFVIIIDIFVPQDMTVLRMILAVLGKGSLAGALSCLLLYTLELYPTEIRQMGMSVGNTAMITGNLFSSIFHITGHYIPILPSVVSAMVPILSAIAASFLFETNGLQLLETIQETENRVKRPQSQKGNVSEDVQEQPTLLLAEMTQAEDSV
ncbi:solute carrier family 22 member 20-like [Gracilinanus agilis]|uniref:solute carrier family 22 member 20-like n=1 Tax=Gracilinanus agilis TaxID=191870 RepID=UPI001CFC4B39|nr:solute carrier family 22 member 20-like [Gracilinanus agilis]